MTPFVPPHHFLPGVSTPLGIMNLFATGSLFNISLLIRTFGLEILAQKFKNMYRLRQYRGRHTTYQQRLKILTDPSDMFRHIKATERHFTCV